MRTTTEQATKAIEIEHYGRGSYEVTVHDPSDAIIRMAQRMADDPSSMVSGLIYDDRVELEARGSRGQQLVRWARSEQKKHEQSSATETTTPAASSGDFCRRCGGPTSIQGRLCGEC